jgi:hypothetical protein
LVFGGANEFQEGVDLDFPDFVAAEFAFDRSSDDVLSTDKRSERAKSPGA